MTKDYFINSEIEEKILNLKLCENIKEYNYQKKILSDESKTIIKNCLERNNNINLNMHDLGIDIKIPYYKVGKSGTTIDLLEIEDLELFFFYKKHAKNQKLIDIGSNIGIHSLIWSKYNGSSIGFEPDPNTYQKGIDLFELNQMNPKDKLKDNIRINISNNNEYINAAIAGTSDNKIAKFIRFVDNPLGNHLEGRKENIYGDFYSINVNLISADKLPLDTNYIKLDAEGADLEILESIIENKKFFNLKCIFLCDWRDTNASGIINLAKENNLQLSHGFTQFPVDDPEEMYEEHRHNFACLYLR